MLLLSYNKARCGCASFVHQRFGILHSAASCLTCKCRALGLSGADGIKKRPPCHALLILRFYKNVAPTRSSLALGLYFCLAREALQLSSTTSSTPLPCGPAGSLATGQWRCRWLYC